MLKLSIFLGTVLGLFGTSLLEVCIPAILALCLGGYIRQIKQDAPLKIEEFDGLVEFLMPHLSFLATNFAVRSTIFIVKCIFHIKMLFTPSIFTAVFWTISVGCVSWAMLRRQNSDHPSSANAIIRKSLLKTLDSTEGPRGLKVLAYIVVHCAWVLATITDILRPSLSKFGRLSTHIKERLDLLSTMLFVARNIYNPWRNRSYVKIYRHSKLNSEREIRLLTLHRRLPYFPVRVSLNTSKLGSNSPYEAISYTWGDAKKNSKILIDGLPFDTTASAFNVLRSRSSIWRTRVIWIDSICINQDDALEKGQQVALMGEIYRQCSRTIVWLGDYEDIVMSFGAIGLIRDLVNRSWGSISNLQFHKKMDDAGLFFSMFRLPALVKLLSHPWFERVWVVQEVALPKIVHVIYGGQYIEWDDLEKIAGMFTTPEGSALLLNSTATRSALDSIANIKNMASIRRDTGLQRSINHIQEVVTAIGVSNFLGKQHDMLPLADLLKRFVHLQSTNPLDKVYALLSLTSDASNRVIIPDYSKTPQLLFTEVSQFFIWRGQPFGILSRAGIGHERKIEGLPSWVPDWTTPTVGAELDFGDAKYVKGAYRASGQSHADITVCEDGNSLRAAAIYIGEIIALGAVQSLRAKDDLFHVDSEGHAFHLGDHKLHRDWLTEARNLAELYGHPPLRTRADLDEAFWRTLCGDTEVTSRPAPPRLGMYYESWVQLLERMERYVPEDGSVKTLPDDEEFWDLVGNAQRWGVAMGQCCSERKFCATKEGYIGLVPPNAKIGDEIWVVQGAPTPYALRREASIEMDGVEDGKQICKLVGECYVDEMMDGEVLEKEREMEYVVLI